MYLREGGLNDLPYCADVGVQAFHDDALMKHIKPFKEQYPESHRTHYLFQCRRLLQGGACLVVAIDADQANGHQREHIVGFALWNSSSSKANTSQNAFIETFEDLAVRIEEFYRNHVCVDKAMRKQGRDAFRQSMDDNVFFNGITDYWELEIMAVSPCFTRRGIGTLLLKWGMELALRDRIPIIVVATPAGAQLYAKHGFQDLGSMDVGPIKDAWSAMVWWSDSGHEAEFD